MAKTKEKRNKEYREKRKIKELERKYKTGFFPDRLGFIENLQSNQNKRELKLKKSYFN